MKNSNIQWIGVIPDSWQLNKIGQLFNLRNEKVSDKDFAPLSVSRGGVVPQMESVAKSDASDDRKLVLIGDFAINSRSDRKQSCGVSPLNGSVSLINLILYAKDSNVIYNDYMNYLLKNYGFAEEFYRWGHGIVADLWTTRWQEMKSIMLPLPSLEMQKKIFDFLNKKILEVNNLIEIENKQIEKLKEYKQAVITEAVTKGLDKSTPMKDSGVEWIGEIPENWSTCRIKNVATISNGKEIEVDGGNIPVYGSGGIFKYTDKPLFSGISLLLGRKGTIDKPMLVSGDFWTVDTMFYTSSIRQIVPKYLFYCAKSLICFDFFKSGSVLPSMTQTELNDVYITYPNTCIQTEIADYLDKKCSEIDTLAKIKQKKIDMLNEYKKSLIYEYVTGKKEVV